MLHYIYALGEAVVGILAVVVAVGLTLGLFVALMAGLKAALGPVWFFFMNAWEERGRG
jgi:hypothetical protein